MPPATTDFSVVLPVKRPELAKTRLRALAGPLRAELARALAADTLAAALDTPSVRRVVVVTDDEETGVLARSLGALVVRDDPGSGLNPALVHGARSVWERHPATVVAALSADLPALRPAELEVVLLLAAGHRTSFLADVAGTGTTLYAATAADAFAPAFGVRSRAAHRRAGAVELDPPDVRSVRRDVDTPVDLWDALRTGVGPRTARVAARLPR